MIQSQDILDKNVKIFLIKMSSNFMSSFIYQTKVAHLMNIKQIVSLYKL